MNLEHLALTEAQKEAVIYALYQIARSDNDLVDSEVSFLSAVSEQFGQVFDHLSVSKFITKNSSEQFKMLCTLNDAQKDFFVVATYAMINQDDKLLDEEFSLTNQFFRAMGIAHEKAVMTISSLNDNVRFY
ncbi:MAG: hypothetical protein AB8B53_02145 [Flavobacteriales bacterium]